jgi:hypothetical protein
MRRDKNSKGDNCDGDAVVGLLQMSDVQKRRYVTNRPQCETTHSQWPDLTHEGNLHPSKQHLFRASAPKFVVSLQF